MHFVDSQIRGLPPGVTISSLSNICLIHNLLKRENNLHKNMFIKLK